MTALFIDKNLIDNLKECNADPPKRLIEHCLSINTNYQKKHYMSVAILIRATLDYVPTIFGFTSTVEAYSQIIGQKTLKEALKQLNESCRNIADDALHNPAHNKEIINISKLTVDNMQGNFLLIIEKVAEQLNKKDLRREGNKKLEDKRSNEVKSPKSQLETFLNYIQFQEWYKENIDDKRVWICKKDNLYQIHELDDYGDFTEPWTQVYPDKFGSGKHSIDLIYNGVIIKRFLFVYCDGGRISVVLPEVNVNEDDLNTIEHVDKRKFVWNKNSLGYKLMNRIGNFYIYDNPEGVARMSKIEIVDGEESFE